MTVKTQGLVLLLELAAVAVETIYRGTAGRRWWAVDSASLTSSGKAPQRTDPKSGKLQGGLTEFRKLKHFICCLGDLFLF